MRGKLSQPRRPLRTTGILLCAVGLWLPLGCSENGGIGGSAEGEAETGWSMPWQGRALESRGKNAPFDWPIADDHPVVQIEIDHKTVQGRVLIELMPELAPKTVEQVLEWVETDFYSGTTFHRVIDGFMIQGGDPNSRDRLPRNDGQGGPGFLMADEISRAPFVRGVVGMGNKGRPDSAGSQFFIIQGDQPSLNGRYTVIGRVLEGMDLVDQITEVEIDQVGRWGPKDRPVHNVVMSELERLGDEASLAALQRARAATALAAETEAAGTADSPAATRETGAELAQSPRD